jgi:hypothetical protein
MKKYLFVGLSLVLATSLMARDVVEEDYKEAGKVGCCAALITSGGTLTAPTAGSVDVQVAGGMGKAGTISFAAAAAPYTAPAPAPAPAKAAYSTGYRLIVASDVVKQFVVPSGVNSIRIGMVAVGGFGGNSYSGLNRYGGQGGGGSGYYADCTVAVTAGEVFTFSPGQSGTPSIYNSIYRTTTPATPGTPATFSVSGVMKCSAAAGGYGSFASNRPGGAGGVGRIKGINGSEGGTSIFAGIGGAGGAGYVPTGIQSGMYNDGYLAGCGKGNVAGGCALVVY